MSLLRIENVKTGKQCSKYRSLNKGKLAVGFKRIQLSLKLKNSSHCLLISFLSIPLLFSGCARDLVNSRKLSTSNCDRGVVYFLPKKLVRVTIDKTDKKFDVVIASQPAVPDSRYCFVAEANHSIWSSDDFKVTANANGLLTSVEGYGEDQSGQIIVKLTEAAVQAAKLVAKMSFPASDAAKDQPEHFEYIFDPSSESDLTELNRQLSLNKFDLKVEVESSKLFKEAPSNIPTATNGIVYRRSAECIITVKQSEKVIARQQLVLPNFGPISVVPLQGGPFVKTTYSMKFDDGLLVEMAANKPSEMLGLVAILPDALKNVASIPAEIFQLKIDYSSKQKELLEARKSLIEAQQSLIDAQKKADEKEQEKSEDDKNPLE